MGRLRHYAPHVCARYWKVSTNMKSLLFLFTLLTWNIALAETKFTYDIQHAGYDFDQYDLKGIATYDLFLSEFNNFPWQEEVGQSNGGSEATISVKNKSANVDLFVSVVGKPNEFAYLIGIVEPTVKKTLFGFGKEKQIRWLKIYLTEDALEVKEAFQLFFENKYSSLKDKLNNLPLFLEQEAVK